MTLANAKRLFEHYVKIGLKSAVQDMLKNHPEFGSSEAPKEASPESNIPQTKSKKAKK